MIEINRQIEIYYRIITSLNSISNWNIQLELPRLELIKENSISNAKINNDLDGQDLYLLLTTRDIFDCLGYFSIDTPISVFLVENKINLFSEKQKINKETLIEIIYIHECAHYIHYHLNTDDFINWNKDNRPHYVESWAQLLTERTINESIFLKHDHKEVFENLLLNQERQYIDYRTDNCGYTKYPDFVIVNYYLLPLQLMNDDFTIVRSANQSLIEYLKEEIYRLEKIAIFFDKDDHLALTKVLDPVGQMNDFNYYKCVFLKLERTYNQWIKI